MNHKIQIVHNNCFCLMPMEIYHSKFPFNPASLCKDTDDKTTVSYTFATENHLDNLP